MKNEMGWYNFGTGEYDYLYESPENFADYIPDIPAAQSMYALLVKMGNSPIESALRVLTACVGEPAKESGQ